MQIISSYGVELRKQNIPIRQTLEIYRSAVSYLIGIYVQVWEELAEIPDIKIKTGMVFLRSMYQMFCSIKTPLCIRDLCADMGKISRNPNQITDSRTVDLQCLADRDILFS